jgi:hypothetical protein
MFALFIIKFLKSISNMQSVDEPNNVIPLALFLISSLNSFEY